MIKIVDNRKVDPKRCPELPFVVKDEYNTYYLVGYEDDGCKQQYFQICLSTGCKESSFKSLEAMFESSENRNDQIISNTTITLE